MRNKPSVQVALLASAILHIRSKRADSRTALARAMELSPSTVGLYIDQLIEDRLVAESGLEQGAKGRPKRQLEVCPEAGWFAGIEFNAERMRSVAIDFAGQITTSHWCEMPDEADQEKVMAEIGRSVEELKKKAVGPLLSIGVGVPGVVEPDQGIAAHYAFIPGWNRVPVGQLLSDQYAIPVRVENNLRAIALSERWFGGGSVLDDYVILGPRSGFGIAIVKNGSLVSGANHAAGEIGRWHWPFHGHVGDMHNALSAPAIWRRLHANVELGKRPRELYRSFEEIRSQASTMPGWSQVINDFARVVGYLHLLLDSRVYFLHGPLTGLGDDFCKAIREEAIKLMPPLADHPPTISPSSMGDDAGALGAASLAMEKWIPSIVVHR